MAIVPAVPVDVYLHTTYEPDMDYVDGELVERHVGEHIHSCLQMLTGALLLSRAVLRYRVLSEQRLLVLGAKNRYRIPDLCVMAIPYLEEPILTTPPHLVIEIVSPQDKTAELLARVSDYLHFGVQHIWIPNPYKRCLQEASRDGIRDCVTLIVETDLVGRVDFNQLYAQLPAK